MKKLLMMLLCMGVCLPSFSLTYDNYIYRKNGYRATVDSLVVRVTDMTQEQMISTINKEGNLPLELGYQMAYPDGAKKQAVIAAAEEKLKKSRNYNTLYNAAIAYANRSHPYDPDDFKPVKWEGYADKAIHYAAQAVDIGKKSGYDKSPYMNLLIGEMYFVHAIGERNAKQFLKDRSKAEAALKNFQKVAELKPILAPYNEMKMLAEYLGQKDLVKKYGSLNTEYTKRKQEIAEEKIANLRATERQVKAQKKTQKKTQQKRSGFWFW